MAQRGEAPRRGCFWSPGPEYAGLSAREAQAGRPGGLSCPLMAEWYSEGWIWLRDLTLQPIPPPLRRLTPQPTVGS